MFQIPTPRDGEIVMKDCSESEYRQWLRQEFKQQISPNMLEQYIEKRVMDIKYQRRKDVIRV